MIGNCRAGFVVVMRAGEKNVLSVRQEIRTGSSSCAGADDLGFECGIGKGVYRRGEYLIALETPGLVVALKSNAFAIKTPVSFRIITSESKLANICKMIFIFKVNRIPGVRKVCYRAAG